MPPEPSIYGLIMLLGVLIGAILWHRRWKNSDPALFGIFIGGLVGAFVGAKLIYFLAEGWMMIGHPGFWAELAFGKTIIGALLGGYGGVEFTKALLGYRKPTGDWFAFMVPLAIAFGRIGCMKHGCCLGIIGPPGAWYAIEGKAGFDRWPAAQTELIFHLLILAVLTQLQKAPSLQGQLFHIYLFAYGIFRFFHEFMRDTPKWIFDTISGYQVASLGLVALAVWRFTVRHRAIQQGTIQN